MRLHKGIGIGIVIDSLSDIYLFALVRKQRKKKTMKTNNKVRLHVRLDHQVQFGDHVVILGSTKELGSWKKNVPMNWTQNGWVCDLELKGDEEPIEFKFVIVNKDNTLVWEGGENRVLKLPRAGKFGTVATWNATRETLELLPLDHAAGDGDGDGDGDEDEDDLQQDEAEANGAAPAEPSPFVGQWQGKAVSFMRSNEHRSHETRRKWDTSGLQGLALRLVQGDQNAGNWWRKVLHFLLSLFIQLTQNFILYFFVLISYFIPLFNLPCCLLEILKLIH